MSSVAPGGGGRGTTPATGPARGAVVWLTATGVAGVLEAWLVGDLARLSAPRLAEQPFDTLLVLGCEAIAVTAVGWLWLLVSILTVDAVRGVRRDLPGVPVALRHVVLLACGLGLAGGLTTPAHAGAAPDSAPSGPGPSALVGLPVPDRTTRPAPRVVDREADRPLPTVRHRSPAREVLVAPGDSLWSLARADLPVDAATSEVDAHWRALHALNRPVIGSDPDVIHPGLRLRLPPRPTPTA